jgi:hypothetical protein
MSDITDELIRYIETFDEDRRRKLLDYARELNVPDTPFGIPFNDILARAEKLNFDPAALDEMEKAVEESCERIEDDEHHDLFA